MTDAPEDPGRAVLSVHIDINRQTLTVHRDGKRLRQFSVSTSRYGPGEHRDTMCTPRGSHIVRAKIGAGQPSGAVFSARRPTGEIYDAELAARYPGRDWILTRILWLSGTEPGRNRLGERDSMRRFIYIHGTPDTEPVGVPMSHGCVRMRNDDVIELFDMVEPGTPVKVTA